MNTGLLETRRADSDGVGDYTRFYSEVQPSQRTHARIFERVHARTHRVLEVVKPGLLTIHQNWTINFIDANGTDRVRCFGQP
jgi:hypothetical protein